MNYKNNSKLVHSAVAVLPNLSRETIKTVVSYLCKKNKLDLIEGVTVKELQNENYLYLDYNRKLLYRLSERAFNSFILKTHGRVVCSKKFGFSLAFAHQGGYKEQSIMSLINFIRDKYVLVKGISENITNDHMKAWFLDMCAMLAEIVDPTSYGPKRLALVIIRAYSLIIRLIDFRRTHSYNPQSLGFGDVSFVAAMFGIPENIITKIKMFQTVASLKTSGLNVVYNFMVSFVGVIRDLLEFIITKYPDFAYIKIILQFFDKHFAFVEDIRYSEQVVSLYTKYMKDSQIMFNIEFRQQVCELADKLKIKVSFSEHIDRPENKYIKEIYKCFLTNIYKYAKTFSVSSRQEPVCFVFEGPAGCGKSRIMNKLVEVLKDRKSVYVHAVPPVTGGKDFYDDYENQEVFVVDDMGQQGLSQWRSIINWVAPVKYPLDCASAEKKNTKFFSSDLILVTTNLFTNIPGFTATDCISSKEALFRRCHVIKFDQVDKVGDFSLHYVKYDYQRDMIFANNFLDGLEPGVLPNLESNNDVEVLRWLMKILMSSLKKQKDYAKSNTVEESDILSIWDSIEPTDDMFEEATYIPQSKECDSYDIGEAEYNVFDKQYKDATSNAIPTHYSNRNFEINSSFFHYDGKNVVGALESDVAPYTYLDQVKAEYQSKPSIESGIRIEELKYWENEWLCKLEYCYVSVKFYIKNMLKSIHGVITSCVTKFMVALQHPTDDEKIAYLTIGFELIVIIFGLIMCSYLDNTVNLETTEAEDIYDDLCKAKNKFYAQAGGLNLAGVSRQTLFSEIISAGSSKPKQLVHCVFSGRRFFTVNHAVGEGPHYINSYLNWSGFKNKQVMLNQQSFKVIKRFSEIDLVCCELNQAVNPFRAIQFCKPTKFIQDFSIVNSDMMLDMKLNFNIHPNSEAINYTTQHGEVKISPNSSYSYNLSAGGLCGSPLIGYNQELYGMHVAGKEDGIGASIIFPDYVREYLIPFMGNTPSAQFDIMDKDYSDFSGCRYKQIGLDVHRPPLNTKLTPTIFYDILDNQEIKSDLENKLRSGEIDEIIEKAPPNFKAFGSNTLATMSKKSFKVIPYIQQDEIDFAVKCLDTLLCDFSPITDSEAAFGNSDITEMNRKSVNGYGYEREKNVYFDYENKIINPEFLSKVDQFQKRCVDDTLTIEDGLAYETMKDELRPIGKVNKPRCFRVMPLHHTFLLKKMIANLAVFIKKNMWNNGIAIGMNPYKDWDKLYQILKEFNLFDGDFGQYDGSAPAQLQDAIANCVLKRFKGTEFEHTILHKLLLMIIRSYVLVKEELYLTTHSLPSGCWVTALFNSFLNRMLTAICLFRQKKLRGEVATVEQFKQIVDFVLGDDKVVGVKGDLKDYVNALTMKDVAESFGMTYTDALKGEIVAPFKSIENCQFLKRKFVYHPVLVKIVGKLDMNTLIQSLRYSDVSKDFKTTIDGKCTALQFELALYPHSESLKSKIITYFYSKNFYTRLFQDGEIYKSMTDDPNLWEKLCVAQGKYDYTRL